MTPARGGWTDWTIYDIQEASDSDYCVDSELLKEWNKLKEKLEDIQPKLRDALILKYDNKTC